MAATPDSSTVAFEVDGLRWSVGLFSALVGAMMLVVPHQFGSPIYAAIRPVLGIWGIVFLLVGLGLVAIVIVRPPWPIVILLHLFAGIELLTLAYSVALASGWTGTASFGVLGLGTALAPFLTDRSKRHRGTVHGDLLPFTIGMGMVVTGLAIVVVPGQLGAVIFDTIRSSLALFGVAFFGTGLLLAYAQVRTVVPRVACWAAHLLAGGTLLAFLSFSSVPLRAWVDIAFYGGFGLEIALYPWLRARFRGVNPTSLQTRLALAFVVVAGGPLILGIAIISGLLGRSAEASAATINAAREASFLILMILITVAAVAGMLISRWLAGPVEALSRAAERLANGDASAPLPSSGADEIVALARSFGEMRDDLADQMADRERLLAEVDAQRRLFQAVIELAPAGIALLRWPELTYEIVNSVYQAIAEGQVMIGQRYSEVFPEVAARVQPIIEQVMRTGQPYHAVDAPLHIRPAPGAPLEERYFTFTYLRINMSEGATYLLSIGTDTTEQVRARQRIEELAEAAQRRADELKGIIDSMVDAVFVTDADGRLRLTNEAAARLLNLQWPREPMPSIDGLPERVNMRHLDGSLWRTRDDVPLWRALRGQTVESEDAMIYNSQLGRDVYVRISAAPIRDQSGKLIGAVAVARDITELIEVDQMKDDFIKVAAHELKTPVAVMKGYSQALEWAKQVTPEQTNKMLDAIDRGADRLTRIVEDLLDASQLQLGKMEFERTQVDLLELVRTTADEFGVVAPKHRVRFTQVKPVVVCADRRRIKQVVVHLIGNAIKYSPAGGDIDIAIESRDNEAVVSVTDHGVGIPKERQARMLDRFYRAHTGTPQDYGGMGVGLYIAREIVERQGGRLWFKSREGEGSTFSFSLPLGVEHVQG